MAASKKVFEVFVSKVPWTVATIVAPEHQTPGRRRARSPLSSSRKPVAAPGPDSFSQDTEDVQALLGLLYQGDGVVGPEEMKEYFGQFGAVKKCLLPFDKETGFHRGFCWIGFSSEEGLNNALQKDPHVLEGAKLQVQRNRRLFAGQKSDKDAEYD
ncbi:unnamed protein product [Oreochromis niloticus]|uniref:RRM domain-containing protein n=1 Tax=Oreochromis aureus TaxID=47969 RepID=A0AAZ1X6H7_OREAU|nr:unnamed protein product [Mustela putorius furo]